MERSYIHESALVRDSQIGTVKLYRNVIVMASHLGNDVSIGDDTTVERCDIEAHAALNRRNYINDTSIGAFTYTGIGTIINWSAIGKFCSIARNVDIGGMNHDYRRLTTMTAGRILQMAKGTGKYVTAHKDTEHPMCHIGNDVWIAAGAQIMSNLTIGDGAVIGAGAIVTHDVPPYAIVVGVPAKVIGMRCDHSLAEELLDIRWWDWPEEVILKNFEYIANHDITHESVKHIREIGKSIIHETKVGG